MIPPSGTQFAITRGGQRAVVVEVGGGLREYVVDGQSVLDGYDVEHSADGGRGLPLLPWPNRLADGEGAARGRHQLRLPPAQAYRLACRGRMFCRPGPRC